VSQLFFAVWRCNYYFTALPRQPAQSSQSGTLAPDMVFSRLLNLKGGEQGPQSRETQEYPGVDASPGEVMMNEECGMMTRQTMRFLFIIHHS
jgi:hypothetical protein